MTLCFSNTIALNSSLKSFTSYFALSRGDWRELEFKEYNFNAKGQPLLCGHLHPLLKVRIHFCVLKKMKILLLSRHLLVMLNQFRKDMIECL